ncbi:phosphomannomutase [Novosphingobium hassiacum]|uniref:Phosphomannomutase n=1 Tax=Novosphingobium hassiacum TaxID=173676 RepID=A0A7W6EV82_9SPHN|nr:phosphomannomutase [Novosphingobium hassiacum]MBB3860013.1 phosphomannomutase [Novosphingobium hassiacum]
MNEFAQSRTASVSELMAQSGVPFGTSGVRGLARAMTDMLCHAYATAFLQYLRDIGEFADGDRVALAGDLRISTPRILAAVATAVRDCGGDVVYCGRTPTPALALYAMGIGIPSIMVTGSHIPADRNGIKFYRPHGEVLKSDEAGIVGQMVTIDPARYDADGALANPAALPDVHDVEAAYVARYVDYFGADVLSGLTIGIYQHSAVGRDLLVRAVEALGGIAVPFGRSEQFVPVDTEAIREEDVALAADWARSNKVDAIISTDGDSDRPLVSDASGTWLRGDIVGLLCARGVSADVVVTPVSSNTVAELSGAVPRVVRTRIGSPYVIAAMMAEADAAPDARVCGYEANGGFLLQTPVDGLSALPTRDALLPIIAVVSAAKDTPVGDVVAALPPRFTYSDRVADFPQEHSAALVAFLSEGGEDEQLARIARVFGEIAGLPTAIDTTDGYRMTFADGAIIHFRPSGNAPELRCYTEAETEARARDLNARALAHVLESVVPEATT